MAFKIKERGGSRTTIHAGAPPAWIMGGAYGDVLDVLGNPYGSETSKRVADASARVDAKVKAGSLKADPLPPEPKRAESVEPVKG